MTTTYTIEDINNATKFADYNTKVRLLNAMYKRAPHLVSHLDIEIRDATNSDFYVPAALNGIAKVMDVKFTKSLCEMLSCNPVKEQDTCKPTDVASYYYVGDSTFDLQCQPSCFNTAQKVTYNEDGSRAADVPMLNWNNNECRIVNSSVISWLEKTFYRSDTKYERRLNDMPTGFSRIKNDDGDGNPFGSGFTYAVNPTYCSYYDRSFDSSTRTCKIEVWETILDAIVGMSLINNIRSSIRVLSNGKNPFDSPENLPKLPETLPNEYTVSGWRNNVNKDFTLPTLIDVSANKRRQALSSSRLQFQEVRRRRRRKRSITETATLTTDETETEDDIHDVRRLAEINEAISKSSSTMSSADDDGAAGDDNITDKSWSEKVKDVFLNLLEMLTTKDFWEQVGIDLAFSEALSKLKQICVKVVEKLSSFLAKSGLKLGESVGTRVLSGGIRSIATHVVSTTAIRLGAKFAVMMARVLAAAASIVGWILLFSTFLDIMFSFWDPYGYNHLFPPELPNDMMKNGELALRQAIGAVSANYTFDNLTAVILSEDEILSIQLESLIDRVTYLDCLVVNSEGSRIDKGPLINPSDGSSDRMQNIQTSVLARRVRFDYDSFKEYNRRFNMRVTLNRYLNYTAIVSIAVAAILSVLTKFSVLSIICFLIGLLVLCVAIVSTQNDVLLDLFETYVKSSFHNNSKLDDEDNYY